MLEKAITDNILKALEHLRYGTMHVTLPDGRAYRFDGPEDGPEGTMNILDGRALRALAFKGDIGFAEAYRDGWWDSDDLCNALLVALVNEEPLDDYIYGSSLMRALSRLSYFFTRNTVNGSKKNIHAHYDIGNDFYRLWLDETMTYSSALYGGANEPLELAQHRKYDRIVERLGSPSGEVLEIGCGWGGFAERALSQKDYRLHGITLSQEQHDFARERLQSLPANIHMQDYRHQDGKFDHIVSIEMFEAVGEQYWPTYFNKLKSLMKDKGKAVIQTITIGEPYFEKYRKGGDMIRTYIFPGGMLPSPTRFAGEAQQAELKVTDRHDFGQDYATTLKQWLERFEDRLDEVKKLGFDEPFIRLWRFYLASCFASFQSGRTNVMQVELQHA